MGAHSTVDATIDGGTVVEPTTNISADGYLGGDFRLNIIPQLTVGSHSIALHVADSAGRGATTGTYDFTVVAPDASPPEPGIVVDSFYVLEVVDSTIMSYEYAPKLFVHDTAGGGGLVIDGFEMLSIPGLTPPFPSVSAQGLIATASTTPLFRELYGDFELAFMAADGHRGSGGVATARLTYHDLSGHFYIVDLSSPIIPGSWPTTYTGGCGKWAGWGVSYTGPCGGAVARHLLLRSR